MDHDSRMALAQELLPPGRESHTAGVVKMAAELAQRYGVDVDRAETAALFHDIFRYLGERAEAFLPESGIKPEDYPNANLLHGPLAAAYLQQKLGITDREVLDAVWYHTTGRPGMGLLEKILFVADKCEEGRRYPGVETLREAVRQDLDQCVLLILRQSMAHLKEKGEAADPMTEAAICYLEKRRNEGLTSENMAQYAARVLYDRKGEDIDIIHVADMTIIADYLVLATGNTTVQVKALCDELMEKMEEAGAKRFRVEGYGPGRWIVCDYGDVLVHIFHREEREFYNLERLWSDGANLRHYEG